MLRDLQLLKLIDRDSALKSADELWHVAEAAQRPEPLASITEGAGDPAQHHLPDAPSLDVVRVVGDQAVEVGPCPWNPYP